MKEFRKRFQDAGSEAAWVGGGQIGVAAGSLLGIKVLTHVLTPVEYGRYSIANTIATMVGISFLSPLGQGLMRYWAIARQGGRLDVFTAVANRYLAVSMVLVAYCAEALMAGYLLASMALYGLIQKVYGMILYAEATATAYRALSSTKQARRMGREIFAFSWPFIVWGVFSWTHPFCDRWSLMAFHDADTVAAVAVIGQLALYPLIFGANFLASYFTPTAYERAGDPRASGSLKPANRALSSMTGIYAAWAAG